MSEHGFPTKLFRLINATLDGSKLSVRIADKVSTSFVTIDGLKQGDALSNLLFNIALKGAIRRSGVQRNGTIITRSHGDVFHVVEDFVYLGTLVTCDNDVSRKVRTRVAAARRAFYGLRNHLTGPDSRDGKRAAIQQYQIPPVEDCFGVEIFSTSQGIEYLRACHTNS